MPRVVVPPSAEAAYWEARNLRFSQKEAELRAGVSHYMGAKWEREARDKERRRLSRPPNGRGYKEREDRARIARKAGTEGPVPRKELCAEARRSLEDFALFRRRYLGRVSTPWQEEAAQDVLRFLATPRKEFVVINCPPGSGKSTIFTHDVPCWLTVRNRAIRGMFGSASQLLANRYLKRMMATFEATKPLKASDDEIRLGVAHDAWATLAGDFGVFKPPGARLWSAQQLLVAQDDEQGEKEPTWTAVGIEAAYIGGRYDFCCWDDTVDPRAIKSLTEVESFQRDWDQVAEKRLEPGGALFLVGQRLGPADIYRYNLDKVVGEGEDEPHGEPSCRAEPGRKYHHIVYRAHAEELCREEHGTDAKPWPEGCLLDPRRLSWRELSAEMVNDEANFLQVYQQEDADPAEVLVDRLWVKGGVDPATREVYLGCWDTDRAIGELPLILPGGPRPVSAATTDPSGGKSWASQWWVYDEVTDLRHLVALDRQAMQADRFLGWDFTRNEFTGLAHEWMLRSRELKRPITHWIMEWNAAQRYLIQNSVAKRWSQIYGVQFIAHETHKNRSDKRLGVEALLRPIWRGGKVRLPGASDQNTRAITMKLVDEVTKWRGDGRSYRNDCVMAQWFFEHNLSRLRSFARRDEARPRMWAPSWLEGTA